MKHTMYPNVYNTVGVELLENPIESNGENEFSADCIQSTKSKLSFAQQDKGSENCIILKQKRTDPMIYPFHGVFFEMEYEEIDIDRVIDLTNKINELRYSGVLCATVNDGLTIVYFNGDIDKFSAHCLFELIRKLACYSKYDSVMTVASPHDVNHYIFKDHSSESTCGNHQHDSVLGTTRTLFLGINEAV